MKLLTSAIQLGKTTAAKVAWDEATEANGPKIQKADPFMKNPLKKFPAYALCPCGSEIKFKWCCSVDVIPKYVKLSELPEWEQLYREAMEGKANW